MRRWLQNLSDLLLIKSLSKSRYSFLLVVKPIKVLSLNNKPLIIR
jgi:hypothetical protein